jgi:hypothetical protein
MAGWFEMKDDTDGTMPAFVFELHDPAKIEHARRILAGTETMATRVMGTIVKSKADYNPSWSFHLDPYTVSFWQLAFEVCDATTCYVEEHLAEVGGATLPNNHWCPWSSRLVAEVAGPSAPRQASSD